MGSRPRKFKWFTWMRSNRVWEQDRRLGWCRRNRSWRMASFNWSS